MAPRRMASFLPWRALSLLVCSVAGCQEARQTAPDESADMSVPEYRDFQAPECASVDYAAMQAPAAMMVLIDRSSSMAANNKWAFAAQAIVKALDQDVFDTMYAGLYAAPTGNVAGPACIFNLPVACQAPPFPQIDLKLAGLQKSGDATGVRHDIKTWLNTNTPAMGLGDASPLYAGVQASLTALQDLKINGKRILFVVTDGTLSCNQFSNRPGFRDCNNCDHDWEHPDNLIQLLSAANKDPQKPVETFIVGVPGADTYDAKGCNYPPYRMRMALSAIAYAGSPKNVPADCDGKTFSQMAADPTKSCHFDMTQGGFSVNAVADAISAIRGKVLGCVFDLPTPQGGGAVDKNRVNVSLTIGTDTMKLVRRKDMNSDCVARGCWDYTPDGKVELVGTSCTDVKTAPNAKVQVGVGCLTVFG